MIVAKNSIDTKVGFGNSEILRELQLGDNIRYKVDSCFANTMTDRGDRMEIERKLNVLSKIANELNKQDITWAVGASLLLYIKGKINSFHDIDIMVSEEDAERVKEILLDLGELQPPNPNTQYKTRYFWEMLIDGVDVDVMGGFSIINDNKEHYFPLKREDIVEHTVINLQRIPLQSLTDWKMYYQLMGRMEKVRMIEME